VVAPASHPIAPERGTYLTDEKGLLYVMEITPEGVLLENASTGEVTWHGSEELAAAELRVVTAAAPGAGLSRQSVAA
jgi:hypothetical protein